MSNRTSLPALNSISEINLTPLMDLTFILLITFIITFPLIEQGVPVSLPRHDAEPLPAERSMTLTINAEGQMFLDAQPVEADVLDRAVRDLQASDPTAAVFVRADEDLRYGRLVAVLKILHDARVTRMALVTQEEGAAP